MVVHASSLWSPGHHRPLLLKWFNLNPSVVWKPKQTGFPEAAIRPSSAMDALVHCNDVIMGAMASQITSLTIVYSTVYSGTDQRKHQSSASLAFARGPVNFSHKWPVMLKMFPFDDVIVPWNCQPVECLCNNTVLWPLLITWFNFNPSMDM